MQVIQMTYKLALIAASFSFCSTAMALDIYVSPSGNDKLDGSSTVINTTTKTGPFKTLAKAQQKIRDIKAAGQFTQPITVHIGKGSYQFKTVWELDDRDSGEPGKEIVWLGDPRATLITGGISVPGCQAYDAANPQQILSCPLSASVVANIQSEKNDRILGNSPKFEVFINDYRLHLARWPNYYWANIRQPLDERNNFTVFQKLPKLTGDTSNAQVHIFAGNDYFDEYEGVSSIDSANNQLTLATPTGYKLLPGRRFYLQNLEEFLDTPQEWHYDKANNRILFIPPYDIIPKSIVISSTKNLININTAHHISFKGLTFRHSTGHAIKINKSSDITLDNLEINNVGGKGIQALQSSNIDILNSEIHDVGQGGIQISGGDRPTLTPANNLIENNFIHNYNTTLLNNAEAANIDGVATTVAHNLITNSGGTGISILGNDHLIEKNEISSICQESGDCGAIYTGRDWTFRGNVVRYNYIHDSYGYTLNLDTLDINKNIVQYMYDGARGIYLDDGASGFTVLGNLFVNAGTIAVQLGGSRDTRVENNIIKTNKWGIMVDQRSPYYNWDANRTSLTTMPITSPIWQKKYPVLSKPMAHDTWPEGNTIVRNLVITNKYGGRSLRYMMPVQTNRISNNLIWHASGPDIRVDYNMLDTGVTKTGALWNDWMSQGVDIGSVFANPCLSITGIKVALTCTDSPVTKLGIKGMPKDIGLIR